MPAVRTQTFGRRGVKSAAPTRPRAEAYQGSAIPPRPVDENFAAIAREMLRTKEAEQAQRENPGGEVPWNWRAAILASTAACFLQAGMYVVAAKGPVEIIPGLKMTLAGDPQALLMAIVLGMWAGARIATTTLMATHVALRFVQMSGHMSYAIAGGICGAGHAWGMQMLTGSPQNLFATAATGLAAGFFYRLFAGAQR